MEQVSVITAQLQQICFKNDLQFDAYSFVQYLLGIAEDHNTSVKNEKKVEIS